MTEADYDEYRERKKREYELGKDISLYSFDNNIKLVLYVKNGKVNIIKVVFRKERYDEYSIWNYAAPNNDVFSCLRYNDYLREIFLDLSNERMIIELKSMLCKKDYDELEEILNDNYQRKITRLKSIKF